MSRCWHYKTRRMWYTGHIHRWFDLHLQFRIRSGHGGFRKAGYLDISLLVVSIQFGYWSMW